MYRTQCTLLAQTGANLSHKLGPRTWVSCLIKQPNDLIVIIIVIYDCRAIKRHRLIFCKFWKTESCEMNFYQVPWHFQSVGSSKCSRTNTAKLHWCDVKSEQDIFKCLDMEYKSPEERNMWFKLIRIIFYLFSNKD